MLSAFRTRDSFYSLSIVNLSRRWSHTPSLAAVAMATYSASVVETATKVYFLEAYDTAAPFSKKTYPLTNFLSSLDLAKSESLYPYGRTRCASPALNSNP